MEVPTLYYLQLYDLINTSMKYCLFKIPHFIKTTKQNSLQRRFQKMKSET